MTAQSFQADRVEAVSGSAPASPCMTTDQRGPLAALEAPARDPDYDAWFADNLSRDEIDWEAADREAYRDLQVEREICAAEIAHARSGDRSRLPALLAEARSLCMASLRMELGV